MGNQTIYFLFTDTGTYLAKAINCCTRKSLNHVSIAFSRDLQDVYSFGRKHPRNPFVGGFVKEDIASDFFRNSSCAVYAFQLSDRDYMAVKQNIKAIEAEEQDYKYNFLGLLAVLLRIEYTREKALFCSQFVATVFHDVETFQIGKPSCFVTPYDIRMQSGMQLIYRGKLCGYRQHLYTSQQTLTPHNAYFEKRTMFNTISHIMKRMVMK